MVGHRPVGVSQPVGGRERAESTGRRGRGSACSGPVKAVRPGSATGIAVNIIKGDEAPTHRDVVQSH